MVFLNAGFAVHGQFIRTNSKENQSLLDTNLYHVVALAKQILPGLEQRKQRSAIVVNSSIASYQPLYGLLSYSSSKILLNYLTAGLEQECKNTDFLLLTPGSVLTAPLKAFIKQGCCTLIASVEGCVRCTLTNLG